MEQVAAKPGEPELLALLQRLNRNRPGVLCYRATEPAMLQASYPDGDRVVAGLCPDDLIFIVRKVEP